MTTKYSKKKYLNANYDKPPLPLLKNNKSTISNAASKHSDLKDRIIKACTEYDT